MLCLFQKLFDYTNLIEVISNLADNSSVISEKTSTEGTIGADVKFADPNVIKEEQQLKLLAKKKASELIQQRNAQRKAEQEAYEKEIKEKQYKRLMHLLSQSKAFANFMSKKVSGESAGIPKGKDNIKRRRRDEDEDYLPRSSRGKRKK